jgi:hypothetical protein
MKRSGLAHGLPAELSHWRWVASARASPGSPAAACLWRSAQPQDTGRRNLRPGLLILARAEAEFHTGCATVACPRAQAQILDFGGPVNGLLMAGGPGSLISRLEFLPRPSAPWRRAFDEHDDHHGGRNRYARQNLACLSQIHGSADGHQPHRVALGRGGRVAVPPAPRAEPWFTSQQRLWPHGHRLRRSLRQAMRTEGEQVNEASNHEQDAKQDRDQHDRCQESFHVPNVTP